MREFGWCAAAATLVGVVLTIAPPASAATADFTSSPESGTAGSAISVASVTPCPAPPAGKTLAGVDLAIGNAPFTVVEGLSSATMKPDRSWTATITISSSARNGAYFVVATCVTADDTAYAPYDSVGVFVVTSPAGQVDPAIRLAGTDRVETAIATSSDLFPGFIKPDAIVLSRSDSFADALAGTPLARIKDAPLLLTGRDALDPRTEAEINRLTPTGTVYLLGGTAAISDAVATNLTNSGHAVVRVAGVNRYETAVKVAGEMGSPSTLLLATGTDFRDGLVAGAAAEAADIDTPAAAVLLTNGATMPDETKNYLATHASSTRYAIGARAAAADPGATPIVGADDADTSRLVAERFFPGTVAVAVASIAAFPDALSGGAHASAFGAPLLLTDPAALPQSISTYLSANKADVVIGFVYGGTAAVTEGVRSSVVQAIT